MTMKLKTLATLLAAVVLLFAPGVLGALLFKDVPQEHPQAGDIGLMTNIGWFNGYEDGTFRPDQPMTDGQMVKVLRRVLPDQVTRGEMASVLSSHWRTRHPSVWSGDKAADAPPQAAVYAPVFSYRQLVISVDFWTDARAEQAVAAYKVMDRWDNELTPGWVDLPRSHYPGRFRAEIPCLWNPGAEGGGWRQWGLYVLFHIWEPPPVGSVNVGRVGVPLDWC